MIQLLVVGQFDTFMLVAEPCGNQPSYAKRLEMPCRFSTIPERYQAAISNILGGQLLYGHMPHEAGSVVICGIDTMIGLMEAQGFEVTPSEEYDEAQKLDAMPLTKEQKRERIADMRKQRDVVY